MIRPNVHLIAAIGNQGQIGFQNELPWNRAHGDLPWFRAQTLDNVVIMGARTAAAVGALPNRVVRIWHRDADPTIFLDAIEADEGLPFWTTIFIAGGAATYRAFSPFASRWLITRIDYDGPADTLWPFALPWAGR